MFAQIPILDVISVHEDDAGQVNFAGSELVELTVGIG